MQPCTAAVGRAIVHQKDRERGVILTTERVQALQRVMFVAPVEDHGGHAWRGRASIGHAFCVPLPGAHAAAAASRIRWVAAAAPLQGNNAACRLPAADVRSRSTRESSRRATAAVMASMSSGSTSAAARPATSGIDVVLEATTGAPLAIASSIGRPNPSYLDGWRYTAA